MVLVGAAAGILHTAIFHSISPMYRYNPAATVNLAGVLFGLGCLTDAVLISGAYYLYSVPVLQVWMAVLPALFGWIFWKAPFSQQPVPHQPPAGALFSALKDRGRSCSACFCFSNWAMSGRWRDGSRCF